MLGENYIYQMAFMINMKFHSCDHEGNLVEKIDLPRIGSRALESRIKCYGGFEYSASVVLFPFYLTFDFIKDAYYHISKKQHLHVEDITDL